MGYIEDMLIGEDVGVVDRLTSAIDLLAASITEKMDLLETPGSNGDYDIANTIYNELENMINGIAILDSKLNYIWFGTSPTGSE